VNVGLTNEYKNCISKNVLGYIKGSKYPDEYIVYTAHWDHIGIGAPVDGDSIYNGALDNASGTAALLAIAESFARSETKPERSVVFLFVTAEEQGLLGSEYYAKNPVFPLDQTVCNINIDGVNPAGLMKDFTITGIGHSEMDEYAKKFAEKEGRYVAAESQPEKGSFFRSDHFNFAKAGVPAMYAEGGNDHAEKGKAYAKEFKDDFVAQKYHAPSDEYDPKTWRLDGMVQDAQIYFNIGFELANNQDWPEWYEGSEFQRKKPLKK
ncbi:MAG: M20/M25/M40 family metallo-hydrolase, partial [Saprospiraceae bacterium]|nr:M20/M25/M40 family metallo-hydrolase [Saprospiraceae bacterium]